MQKKFRSQDGEVFEVREVSQVDNELWVYYNKVGAEHEYSCLLEAFRIKKILLILKVRL